MSNINAQQLTTHDEDHTRNYKFSASERGGMGVGIPSASWSGLLFSMPEYFGWTKRALWML